MILDKSTKELSPCHVQLLNTMSANKKKQLDCFNEALRPKEKYCTNLCFCQAANHDVIIIEKDIVENDVAAEEGLVHGEALTKTVAWSDLGDTPTQAQGN